MRYKTYSKKPIFRFFKKGAGSDQARATAVYSVVVLLLFRLFCSNPSTVKTANAKIVMSVKSKKKTLNSSVSIEK